jgi:ubiquinone/menaquinone biosynthesis C-methylase UbiE
MPSSDKPAFAAEARRQRAASLAKAAWWTATASVARAAAGPPRAAREGGAVRSPPPPKGHLRQLLSDAFARDAADVAAGLYPAPDAGPVDPLRAVQRALDVVIDARAVQARRSEDRSHIAEDAVSAGYPRYYRQNFHHQSGGWFTPESARRYEAQVEALFSGAAGPMRRRALALLARAWRGLDQRGRTVVDVACGSGSFLADLGRAFPRAQRIGVDLSPPYLDEARRRSGADVVQAAAERLPFADASLDAITCVYLFHELPPKLRPVVAAEMARVLRPGGLLAFADSVQAEDAPETARLLESFPVLFHEPYYASYQEEDLPALFERAGLVLKGRDQAFLTKALLFERPV